MLKGPALLCHIEVILDTLGSLDQENVEDVFHDFRQGGYVGCVVAVWWLCGVIDASVMFHPPAMPSRMHCF
jgi:hypothetical protein